MAETKKEGEKHYENRFVKKEELVGETLKITSTRRGKSKFSTNGATLILADLVRTGEKVIFYGASVMDKQVVEQNLIGKKVVLDRIQGSMATYFSFREV